MAITRSAPSRNALLIANCPTGPQPQTATVSPPFQVAEIGSHEAGREDIREEQDLLVAESLRHLDRADVGIGHAEVFGLAAGIAAQHVGIAEQAGRRMPPELLGHLVIGVGALAAGEKALFAEEAFAAGDRKRHYDAVANLELLVFGSDFDDFAHGLMAENVALFHRGHDAVEQMQVRTADGAGRNFDDGVAAMLESWDPARCRSGCRSCRARSALSSELSKSRVCLKHKRPDRRRFRDDGNSSSIRGTRSASPG